MEMFFILTSLFATTLGSCPHSWRQYENSCYRVFDTRAPFDSALRRCAGHQGYLVSLKSYEEKKFVRSLISSYLDNQFWIGIHFNQTSWYWLDDGTEVTWSRWAGPKSACALMTGTQRWTSEKCTYFHQYICESDVISTTEAHPPSTTSTSSTERKPSSTGSAEDQISSTSRDTTSSPARATTTTTVDSTTEEEDESLEQDSTPEEVVIDRKKNPGRTHTDNRPSAIGIGSMGVGVMICAFLGVFFLDASKLWRDFAMFRHNLTEIFRCANRKPKLRKKPELINSDL